MRDDMEETIRNFPKQFEWEPKIKNEEKLKRTGKYVLCGMGGSHLQGDIFQTAVPGFDVSVHQDYGLPKWPNEVLKNTLVVASSYSGNTEEIISAFQEAVEKGIPVAAISIGGKLLELAKKEGVPYIQVPNTGIAPRAALGFTFKALAKMLGREDIVAEATSLANLLKPQDFEQEGKKIASVLEGKIPVVYASQNNYSLAYTWKIKLNESTKIPAFCNVFPELNHNEINGFDVTKTTREVCEKFSFVFLVDSNDNPRIQNRMEILMKLYHDRELPVQTVEVKGETSLLKIFSSLVLADWVSLYLAKYYGTDPQTTPMVEEFKKLIA